MDLSLSLPELSEAVSSHQSRVVAASVGSVAIREILGVQQDEAAIKKQKRMEANRMSAQRSRQRKQAECEELKLKVETLDNENQYLKNQLEWTSEECKNLKSENYYLKELAMVFKSPQAAPPNIIVPKVENDNAAPFPFFSGDGNRQNSFPGN